MVKQKNWPQLLQRAKPQGLLGMEPATHSLVRLWKTYIFPIATQMEPGTNVKARTCEQKMWHNLEMLALTPVTPKSPNLANYLPVWNGICFIQDVF